MKAALLAAAPIILALLAVSAVFSAAETALTRASRGRMHQLERDGDKAAKRVNRLISDQEMMIGAVLIAYNVLNILSSVLAARVFQRLVPGAWGVALATALMTVLVVVFVEVLPKTLAILRADDVARRLSAPMLATVRVLGPVIFAIQWIVRHTLRFFGVRLDMATDVLAAHEEIRGAVEYHHAEGSVESRDRRMLGGVLDLREMDVSEVMVHRTNIAMVDADLPSADIVARALESEHTRLPLFRGEPENIVGVLHARDLLRALVEAGGRAEAVAIAAVMREPWFIPETTNLKDQLNAFLRRQSHFALVVDEYGALQGLITLEDILEEIVGEIEDEYDEAPAPAGVRRQSDGSVLVAGEVTVRELNRAVDWDLPDDLAVTIAGLVIHEARSIPEVGQQFRFFGRRFQILRRQRHQITLLRISPDERASAEPAG
ncbi:MAG TPA: HlyC/CorC family transporter [Caulobacteraceae bacterium]|nr:HlyC/CorC family transporter [Caulobacteraceae bacterium]